MVCWVATVSRPGIRARLAQLASKVNPVLASDIYRINDLIKTAKESGARINRDLICRINNLIYRLQQAADLKYLSGPHLGTLAPAGWSDPAAIGLFRSRSPLVSPGPLQHFALVMRSAKFMRKHEFARRRTSPASASELYAFSEMVGRAESSRAPCAPFAGASPAIVRLEDCENVLTHPGCGILGAPFPPHPGCSTTGNGE